jgi:alpha-mannosidase II
MEYVNEMFPNHQQIHDHLNKNEKYHVNIKFSNLTNYFESVAKSAQKNSVTFPVLKGDFFTYADREQDYW